MTDMQQHIETAIRDVAQQEPEHGPLRTLVATADQMRQQGQHVIFKLNPATQKVELAVVEEVSVDVVQMVMDEIDSDDDQADESTEYLFTPAFADEFED